MQNKASGFNLMLLGVSIAIGISIGDYFIDQTMYNTRVAINTAEANRFTKLNEIKPDMLKEATKNARIAASAS